MVFLAHLTQEGRQQPLCEHLLSVANATEESAVAVGIPHLGRLIGLTHDWGKAIRLWQEYLKTGRADLKGKVLHASYGSRWLWENRGNAELAALFASYCVQLHHSGMKDFLSPDGEDCFTPEVAEDSFYAESTEQYFAAMPTATPDTLVALLQQGEEELEAAMRTSTTSVCGAERPEFGYGLILRFLYSCLLDADWEDTAAFAENRQPIQSLPVPSWEKLQMRLEKKLSRFEKSTPIAHLRQEVADQCAAAAERGRGIYRLRVDTGGGKTLSSLLFALKHAKKHGLQHIFYIAPFKSILEQNADEIRSAIGEENVAEHHSDVIFGSEEQERTAERWLAPCVVTTAVQFFNAFYAGSKQAIRRLHRLANSVILFDEVQSIPPYCQILFHSAVNFLSTCCGATVVLCSATVPPLETLAIPVRYAPEPEIVTGIDFTPLHRTRLIYENGGASFTCDELARQCAAWCADRRSMLCVFNTKAAARQIYQRLQALLPADTWQLYFLSTALCAGHRAAVVREIREKLSRGERLLCVSTQLIEAGVDLSFDCAVRDLAGLTSVAQTAGRCNRHGESPLPREVHIAALQGENLSMLPEIAGAAQSSRTALGDQSGDITLSPEVMTAYYQNYFSVQRENLFYRVAGRRYGLRANVTLYDLLSVNTLGSSATREVHHQRPRFHMKQAFGTAGSVFEAISSNSRAALVPYGQGATLIDQLAACRSMQEAKPLLRRAQPYAVNLFPWQWNKLMADHRLGRVGNLDIWALTADCYDPVMGLKTEDLPAGLGVFW